MKHLYIIRYKYRGYTINVYTSNTAAVVCKQLKRKYIPFFTREDCETCVDDIIEEFRKEEEYSTWTYRELKRTIELEMEGY